MSSPTLSVEQQRELLRNLTRFLSLYKHISDSYIIEFFTEDLWETLPVRWQEALGDLSPPQIADLLLDRNTTNRSYPSVWPLSLLAFRATAHALAFPRMPQEEKGAREVVAMTPEEFQGNQSQSALLGHIFRKHVKPKKQHEIRRLGMLVKRLCDLTGCTNVVDVGSGQGHLTRFLSFGLGLSVTGIEADPALVAMASKFDGQLTWTLEKEKQKKNVSPQLCMSGPLPRHVTGWVNPKASWEVFIEQLGGAGVGVSGGQEAASGPCKKRSREADCSGGERPVTSSVESPRLEESGAGSYPASRPDEFASPSSPKRLCKMAAGEGPCSGGCPCREGEEDGCRGYPDVVLTGLHACGDLSATLLRHFAACPHVRGITSVACCYMKITTREHPAPPGLVAPPLPVAAPTADGTPATSTGSDFGYPMSSWVRGLPGHQLSYKAREGACHALEDYAQRLREDSALLRTHGYRAALETVIRGARPQLRRAGIQTVKKAHLLSFTEYARLGLPRAGLPADLALDGGAVAAMLRQQGRVVVYFSLALMLAPAVETLVLLDRMTYLQERGIESQLVPLFDPGFSPRNLVLVALKPEWNGERTEGRTSN